MGIVESVGFCGRRASPLPCRHESAFLRTPPCRRPSCGRREPSFYASLPGQFPLICIASISAVFFALSMSFTLMRMNSSALPLSL
jgi:hypothetical protein